MRLREALVCRLSAATLETSRRLRPTPPVHVSVQLIATVARFTSMAAATEAWTGFVGGTLAVEATVGTAKVASASSDEAASATLALPVALAAALLYPGTTGNGNNG